VSRRTNALGYGEDSTVRADSPSPFLGTLTATRRQFLGGLAALPLAAQQRSGPGAMRLRATPTVCLYSQVLIEISHVDMPRIVQALGFDGVDLSVQPGGHVLPAKAGNFLMPALEACTGIGLDVPMITTALTALEDKDAQDVLGLASFIKVPYFRPGHWKMSGSVAVEMQLPMVQRQVLGLAQLARATGMTMGVHNYIEGAEGAAVDDIARVIRPADQRLVGFDFDVGYAAAQGGDKGFQPALETALPRLKMVSLRDFKLDESRKMIPCPLGEGVVNWPAFFTALAKARFAGPISLQVDHQPQQKLPAIKKDLAFVRAQVDAAWK
jgi:L-ribulose-5-phosphate 3-epimerase